MQTQNEDKIDQLLKMAEEYTHNILKTSLQMRQSEIDNRKKSKVISGKDDPRNKGSKRKRPQSAASNDEGEFEN